MCANEFDEFCATGSLVELYPCIMPLSTTHAMVALVCATVAVAVAATPLPPRFLPAYEAQGAVDGWHMYYDGPGLRYRQDVVAYGSDTTITLFYCDNVRRHLRSVALRDLLVARGCTCVFVCVCVCNAHLVVFCTVLCCVKLCCGVL